MIIVMKYSSFSAYNLNKYGLAYSHKDLSFVPQNKQEIITKEVG